MVLCHFSATTTISATVTKKQKTLAPIAGSECPDEIIQFCLPPLFSYAMFLPIELSRTLSCFTVPASI